MLVLGVGGIGTGCSGSLPEDDDDIIVKLEPALEVGVDGTAASTLDYGQVNVRTYVTKEFVIQNTGQAMLHLGSVALKDGGSSDSGKNYYEITQAPAPEVPAGQRTTVRVRFWAYQYNSEGTTDVVIIESDDPRTPKVELGLQAVVVKPSVNVTPSALNFPNVSTEQPSTQSLIVQNVGDGKLQLLDLAFDAGMEGFSVSLPSSYTYGQPLAPGLGVTVQVTFAPTTTTTVTGNLTVTTNDPDRQRILIPITANGQEEVGPVVDIISPEPSETFYTGSTVLLQAKVSDPNESPDKLTLFWSSTVEGQLCPGVKANAQTGLVTCSALLSTVGPQTITLVALDTSNKTGTDTVAITIWNEETPLNYVISGSDTTSLYAFTPDDNIQIWVIDGLTGERADSPCVYAMDNNLEAEPPRACNAKYGDYIHVQVYDRYGLGTVVPKLYLWYGNNDEHKQAIVPEQLTFAQGVTDSYLNEIECEPRPTMAQWLDSNPPEGTYPEDCLVYDNSIPELHPDGDGMMMKVTIPPPEPTEETPAP